jgi:hypothetical protein
MKKTLFVLCLLSTTGAFAQYYGGSAGHIDNTPVVYESPSHPAHASYTPMTSEQSVLGSSSYSSAQGERRASDFPQAEGVSLGAYARDLRKQRAESKKSHVIWINQ